MVESLTGAAANALSGLTGAAGRIDRAAQNIANAGTATAGTTATGGGTTGGQTTGGRIGNAAGLPIGELSGSDGDLTTNLVSVAAAKISYAANAKVLSTVGKLDRDTLDIVT